MLTPSEWNAALAPGIHWKQAYPVVEQEARAFLDSQWDSMTTNALVAALYPAEHARGDVGAAARKRLYQALMTLSTHGLTDCATKASKAKRVAGKWVVGWIWHASKTPKLHAPEVCPCCKRPL